MKKSDNNSKPKGKGNGKKKNLEDPTVQVVHDESMDIDEQRSQGDIIDKTKKVLDLNLSKTFDLGGIKGHVTMFTSQTIEVGLFYFEVKIEQPYLSISDYTNIGSDFKKHDEFLRKYYSELLNKNSENYKKYSSSVRIGLIHKEGDLELPLGCNEFSYAYRSYDGYLIKDCEYQIGNSPLSVGDIVGVLVFLKPPMPDFLKEDSDMKKNSKGIYINQENYIKYYVNGILQSEYFLGLCEGSYYPAITLYNFAKATLKFGKKDLKYSEVIEKEYRNVKWL